MPIAKSEKLIQGAWELVDGRIVADASLKCIHSLIDTELEKVGTRLADGKSSTVTAMMVAWERFFPFSEMHGGGPESLRCIEAAAAADKYGVQLETSDS